MIPLRDANPTRRTPIVTLTIIAVASVAFAYELGIAETWGNDALEGFLRQWGALPVGISTALTGGDLVGPAMVGMVTSIFLHGGWLHLIGNMLYLWIFGNNIEDRFGRIRFLVFYLAGGVAAALTHVAIDPASDIPMVGASGAIAAILGAYLVLYPRARILSLVFLGVFYQLIEVRAIIVLGFWFVLQLIDGLTSLGVPETDGGIAFFAHIGGFVAGVLVGFVVRAAGPRGRSPVRSPVG